MEYVGYDPNVVHASVHTMAYNHAIGTQKTATKRVENVETEFHIYALEWTADRITAFIDGQQYFSFANDGRGDVNTWPFNKPFYLKLNLAWGGNWGGAQGVDESKLPATYEIDYVRVYQKIKFTEYARASKVLLIVLFSGTIIFPLFSQNERREKNRFISVVEQNLVTPDGKVFLMKGINLGNWLNPEGYMFLFQDVNSYRLIDQALKEMVGPDFVNQFWRKFQENYITQDDIRYIRQTGMNSIRIPFHYKLFTCEDFMGSNNPNRGFELLDSVIQWCKEEGLYVVLDMHAAPGGQTGDNIDDSYSYPWYLRVLKIKRFFVPSGSGLPNIMPMSLPFFGYDLLNEPIAHFFDNKDELNNYLEPLYRKATEAIREVDKNHIVIWGGAQWEYQFFGFPKSAFRR
jgi:hypothetical protein